jgi:hypothetical protein
LDRGSGGGSTISMTSVALVASGATASETSGTKADCEAGGAVTPTVAAASEAERLMVAATEDSAVAASEAERPVVAPEDSVVVASEAERPVVAPEDPVAVASEAERPVVAPEDLVVVASEAEAEAATAVDTARSISSHSKQAAGNFQPLFSFVFGFLQLYRFPKSFMPGNQLRIDCSAPATGGKEPKTVIQVWCRKKVRRLSRWSD